MKKLGPLHIVFALAIALVPTFTQCQAFGRAIALANGKTVPMKCHWTAEAAIATAAPLAIAGVMIFLNRKKESQQSLNILTGILGVITILLPTALFGVCADQSMLCNMIMRPTLILAGTLVVAASLAGLFTARRMVEGAA